ncbi:FAD-dependent oxidoreductase [Streptomyces sp. RPA4-5]|uniref:NAD(P)/FAD-dependent oxidoreductase n=1 Tax=Streptomyces sp. RPA4-5 TaxID=2721245 RepID=UPI00143EE7EA|nr:FAD-dependent oxidoreductase [Streptomyces sp. RPA4-5]QIY53505.1 FAD-dependent oxidoreductase [Streptomyces sp. RPA4-5]
MSSSDQADVVVIGAGIIGSFTAYYLARAGLDVVVLDPAPGGGASSGNAGMLVPSFSVPMSNPATLLSGLAALRSDDSAVTLNRPLSLRTWAWLGRFAVASRPGRAWKGAVRLHELAVHSRRRYDELVAEENLDLGLGSKGWLWAFHTADALDRQLKTARRLQDIGIRHQELDADAARAIEPGLSDAVTGAVLFPDDRGLDPARATAAVAEAARRRGARFMAERVAAAEGVGSRTTAVRTGQRTVRARWFVLATGADSAAVGGLFGVRLPVEPGYGWSLRIPTSSSPVRHPLMCAEHHVVVNPAADHIRLTGGMAFGGRPETAPCPAALKALRAAAERTVPGLSTLTEPGEPWRGARPMTPSGMPIIRPVAPNVIAATGHGTLGMTLAPATAKIVQTCLLGGRE